MRLEIQPDQTTPENRIALYEEKGYLLPHTIGEHLEKWAGIYGERIALVDKKRRISYMELNRYANETAAGMLSLGIKAGDRVIIQFPNCIEFIIFCFASFRLGAIPVLSMIASRESDIDALCSLAEPAAYITTGTFLGFDHLSLASLMAERHSSIRHIITDGDDRYGAIPLASLRESSQENIEIPGPHYRDTALLLLSGGTTGTPKLIPRTHTHYSYNFSASAARCMLTDQSVYLAVLPAAHNFPLACPGIMGTLSVGGRVVLSQTAGPDEAFPLIEQERVTITAIVPSLVNFWLEAREWEKSDISSLELLQVGGAALNRELAAQIKPVMGCTLQQVFGMAEGLLCYTALDDPDEIITGTQGKPLCEDDEIRLVDQEGGDLPPSEVGELLVRGPYTIDGYYRAPETNRDSFTSDGFFRSGDMVKFTQEGNIQVMGRIKEQINRAGEKISTTEMEMHLCSHPEIESAVITALPDETLGERSCAFVISSNPRLELVAINRFLLDKGVARHKIPDQLELIDSFPLTNIGKINRRALVSMVLA